MNVTNEQRVLAVLALVVVGLPAGLCSLGATPLVAGRFFDPAYRFPGWLGNALGLLAMWLLGLVVAVVVIG
jgi:hypothetical protein